MTCNCCDKTDSTINNCIVNCDNIMSCKESERREYVTDCTQKMVVLLESTGIKKICNKNKIFLQSVIVYGPTKQNDITDVIMEYNHIEPDTSVESIYIDTGKLNSYGGCDVECGHRKSVRVAYITEILDEVTPSITHDTNEVYNKIIVNRYGKKKCGSCHKHSNHCQCHVQTLCSCCNKYCCVCSQSCIKCHKKVCICNQSCIKCHKKVCICNQSCIKCHKKVCVCNQSCIKCHKKVCICNQSCKKCHKKVCICNQSCIKCHKKVCVCNQSCKKCHKKVCVCNQSCIKCHKNNCCCKHSNVKMSSMLYIPIYPIARPYMCANPKFCKCVGKCDC